ncbi:MAG TPA: glycosyltransferase [Dyadobacter sp.]|nr:glycosyltransferase [Dyadobacter sp.]
MLILHVINNLNKGGAERLLVDNLPLYKSAEINVEVLQLSKQNSEPTYLELLQANGVKCHHLSSGILYNPLLIFKIVSFLTKNKFDIVHVHLFPALYWIAVASWFLPKKPKLIFTEHSTQNKRSKNSLLRPIERVIYGSYDHVVAISEQIRLKLNSWTQTPAKIELIRNGVNTKKFTDATSYDDNYFNEFFSIQKNSVKLLMTARFSYPKDHVSLVKAVSLLPENYYLILVGEGPNRQKVEELSRELGLSGRIVFAGFRNDVPSLMKSVDFNILSTEYEGMSGVSLEALASGTPFLGSDVAGVNDLVPDERYLFPAGSANEIAKKIQSIMNSPGMSESMRKDGLEHARNFDISIHIRKHRALYFGIINS